MMFMAIMEGNWKDMDKLIEKYRRRIETGDAIKDLFGPIGIIGEPKIFTFFEMDNPDEIIKMVVDYAPEVTINVYLVEDATRLIEIWQERNK